MEYLEKLKKVQKLLAATRELQSFLEERPCGQSYWVDYEGDQHVVDIGYVADFLYDLNEYLAWAELKITKPYKLDLYYKNGGHRVVWVDQVSYEPDRDICIYTNSFGQETIAFSQLVSATLFTKETEETTVLKPANHVN